MRANEVTDWIEFLEDLGLSNVSETEDWAMVDCVFHNQKDTSRPSLGINKISGVANCLGCGSHSWKNFCEIVGISCEDLIDGVREKEWESFKKKMKPKKEVVTFNRYNLPLELKDPYSYKGSSAYIKKQGYLKRTIIEHNVKLCLDEKSKYFNYLIIPVYDKKGVLYFDARYVGNKDKVRWLRPKKCAVNRTFWNWKKVKTEKYCIFVEGISDALKIDQFGLNVIPAKTFSKTQRKLIFKSNLETIFLLYDNDEAGRFAKNKNGEAIDFTSKTHKVLDGCGIDVVTAFLPSYADDPADIKAVQDLVSKNKKLNFYFEKTNFNNL
jgi:hypothetical protein